MTVKKLFEYFKETAYGHDTRSLTKNIREFLADNGVVVKVTKNSKGKQHTGPRVTGEERGIIELNIETKQRFNLTDFVNQLSECSFKCDTKDRIFPMDYVIPITINGIVALYSYEGSLQLGTKFRGSRITEDMMWALALDGISYSDSYMKDN